MVPRNRVTSWLTVTFGAVLSLVVGDMARSALGQTVSTWNGASGTWDAAANWSTNPFFPNNGNGAPTYQAVIGAGTVDLNTDITLAALTLNGGTLNGAGHLTTTDLTLNGGTLATTGAIDAARFVFTKGTLARDLVLPAGATHELNSLTIAPGFTLTNPNGSTLRALDGGVSGQGSFTNVGTITKIGAGYTTLNAFANAPTGAVNVQQGKLWIAGIGTHEGTFTVVPGATLIFGGQTTSNNTLATSSLITGGGSVRAWKGTLTIMGDGSNDYSGGTTIEPDARVIIDGAGTALGAGAVTIQGGIFSGGILSIDQATNLLPAQAVVSYGGALAIRSNFIPQSLIAPSSAGTIAIDFNGFSTPVDMAVLGTGSMALGSSTVGSYTAATIAPGTGDTYRLGGGGGTLTLTQANVLTGNRPLLVRGPGVVELAQPQNFTGGTTLDDGTLAISQADSLGSGAITFQGGSLRVDGGPMVLSNAITMNGGGTISGQHDLTLEGPTTLVVSSGFSVTNAVTVEIAGSIGESVAGREFRKHGPGTLVLAASNSFTGGLAVYGGTVIVAVDQHYQGATNVALGGVLVLNGDLTSTGALRVGVKNGGTVTGEGTIAGPASFGFGIVSPGHSTGTIEFASGLVIDQFSKFVWELATLTTENGGANWDRIDVTGGALTIQLGAIMDIGFLDPQFVPSANEPFWTIEQRWSNIVRLAGTATNPSGFVRFAIDNTPYAGLGYFETAASITGPSIDLVWRPGAQLGDLNSDGAVNMFDVNVVSEHWGEAGPTGDVNGDGAVNMFDVNVVSLNWSYAPAGGGSTAAAAVPEPATWLLTIVAASLLCLSRRPRRAQSAMPSTGLLRHRRSGAQAVQRCSGLRYFPACSGKSRS